MSNKTTIANLNGAKGATHVKSEPVFIIGSPRSGTSLTGQILDLAGWGGFGEGHIFNILVEIKKSIESWHVDHLITNRNSEWAVDSFPTVALEAEIVNFFDNFHSNRFGATWYDKTPGHEAIAIAPTLKKIFPRAKFIFCKRRIVDIIASSMARFGDDDRAIRKYCDLWCECMSNWLQVKKHLGLNALEIEQEEYISNPSKVSDKIVKFLKLKPEMSEKICNFIKKEQPESTGGLAKFHKLSELPINSETKKYILQKSEYLMGIFGYGFEQTFTTPRTIKFIKFTRDPKFIDIDVIEDGFYKFLGEGRFLLHPAKRNEKNSSITFKGIDVNKCKFVQMGAQVMNSNSKNVVCKLELFEDDVLINEITSEPLHTKIENLILKIPRGRKTINIKITCFMELEIDNNDYAWLNIIDLKLA